MLAVVVLAVVPVVVVVVVLVVVSSLEKKMKTYSKTKIWLETELFHTHMAPINRSLFSFVLFDKFATYGHIY